MNGGHILENITILIENLKDDGLKDEAERIRDILDNRFIWDQMIEKLRGELQLLNKFKCLSNNTKRKIKELLVDSNSPYSTAYQKSIYSPIKDFANELGYYGMIEWKNEINKVFETSQTSLEVYMALKKILTDLNESKCPMNNKIKIKLKKFLLTINTLLQQ